MFLWMRGTARSFISWCTFKTVHEVHGTIWTLYGRTNLDKKTSKRTPENIWVYYQPMTNFRLEVGVEDFWTFFSRPFLLTRPNFLLQRLLTTLHTPPPRSPPPHPTENFRYAEVKVTNDTHFRTGCNMDQTKYMSRDSRSSAQNCFLALKVDKNEK
jgi:hypothetical protein